MTDKELLKLCQKYGAKVRKWSNKFAALLPEVQKRRLYRKHGCCSIEEFAAKVAGFDHDKTRRILNLNKKLEDKPLLKAQIETQGWSKLRVVANIATPETDQEWAEKVEALPKKALETYVSKVKSVPGDEIQPAKWSKMNFPVKPETELRLRKFRQKLEKEKKEAVTLGEALEALLDQAEEPPKQTHKSKPSKEGSRNISAGDRREVEKKYGGKCAICDKPYTEIHHPDRFAVTRDHKRLVPLCHDCHRIVHAGLIENEHDPPKDWRVRNRMKPNAIDKKYLEMANGP